MYFNVLTVTGSFTATEVVMNCTIVLSVDKDLTGVLIMNDQIDELLKGTNYARNFGSKGKVQDKEGVCSTLQAAMGSGGGNIPIVKDYFMGNLRIRKPTAAAMRGRYNSDGKIEQRFEISDREAANTITTVQKDSLVTYELRVRKFTPKECYRLMGFSDDDFNKAEAVCSNTQLYKQAGNSIVVDVLENLFENLYTYLYT